MIAVRVPDPNSAGAGNVDVSAGIYAHAVGNAAAAFLLPEHSAVLQLAAIRYVVHANLMFTRVINIQTLSIGRKRETVRLRQIFGQETNFAAIIQPVDALKRNFPCFAFR